MTAPTPQSIFNQVAEHLLTQNAQSFAVANSRNCAYRGTGGRKCAVGCLITDEHYHPSIEGCSSTSSGVASRVLASIDPSDTLQEEQYEIQSLLRRLQTMHDHYAPTEWPKRLGRIATEFNLKPFTKE